MMKIMDKIKELHRIFKLQKDNYSPSKAPSYRLRMDRLERLDKLIRENLDALTKVTEKDFGTRSQDLAFVAEIISPLMHGKYVRKKLKKWMKPELKPSGFLALTGQKTYIHNEPLGVVGIMTPFNAPICLALDPAIEAIAGGNSVMIKFSESTPHTANLMSNLISHYFEESEIAVVDGELEVAKEFASLAWDKFFFTGGAEVAKKILEANAKNLTPAILELGGKSPCIILDDANVKEASQKISTLRQQNSGQICIAGDYVFVPEIKMEEFIQEAIDCSVEKYPTILDNQHYTSVINDREFDRIVSYIDEAKENGCRIIMSNPNNEALPNKEKRKIPLTIIVNPPKHLKVSQQEIFGPILTVFSYNDLDQVIEEINRREKALALYVFGKNKKQINKIVMNTSSGGVTTNDLMMHANSNHMGFGGVGNSGMGRYKGGKLGFYAFTNPKAVHHQGLMRKYSGMFNPPYNSERPKKMLRSMVGIK
jgi:coniferyl-aldehyde dehydrogenase